MESMYHLVLEKQKKIAIHGVHMESRAMWSPCGVHENSMGQGKVHASRRPRAVSPDGDGSELGM